MDRDTVLSNVLKHPSSLEYSVLKLHKRLDDTHVPRFFPPLKTHTRPMRDHRTGEFILKTRGLTPRKSSFQKGREGGCGWLKLVRIKLVLSTEEEDKMALRKLKEKRKEKKRQASNNSVIDNWMHMQKRERESEKMIRRVNFAKTQKSLKDCLEEWSGMLKQAVVSFWNFPLF